MTHLPFEVWVAPQQLSIPLILPVQKKIRSRSEKSALALVWVLWGLVRMLCHDLPNMFWDWFDVMFLSQLYFIILYWLSITFRVERRLSDLNWSQLISAQPEGRHDAVLAEQIRNSDSIWCCQSMLRPKPRFFSCLEHSIEFVVSFSQ